MSNAIPNIVVFRENTEGLSMEEYTEALRERLPQCNIQFAKTPIQERTLITDASVATGVRINEDVLTQADNLQLFACVFAGTDHLPLDKLADRDVIVTNAGGIHAPGIAEQTIGQMLVFARQLHKGWRRARRREWRHFQAGELNESTVTIVGLGSIGQTIVERLRGFNLETIGVRYTPSKGGPTDEVIGYDPKSLHDALARTDYLVLACPLTETTENLISEAEFNTLPVDAVVINASRGGVIDTDALVPALQSNDIRGAALDVTDPEPLPSEHPLWTLENAIITPHTGGHTPRHWPRLADIVARNVEVLTEANKTDSLKNKVIAPEPTD